MYIFVLVNILKDSQSDLFASNISVIIRFSTQFAHMFKKISGGKFRNQWFSRFTSDGLFADYKYS